jgi:hypothetical protein
VAKISLQAHQLVAVHREISAVHLRVLAGGYAQSLARGSPMWHSTSARSTSSSRQEHVMDLKTLLIVALVVAVAVLGYLYYESQQNVVRVDLPGVKIEAK